MWHRWLQILLSVGVGLGACAPECGAALPYGTFGGTTITTASSIEVNDAACGRWHGHEFSGTSGYADLAAGAEASQTRALVMCIPMVSAATYSLTSSVYRTSHLTQTTYWHVLAVQSNVSLNLGHAGIPTTITQAGVKSLKLTQLTDSSANSTWRTTTETFTVSGSDASTYQYLVFAFIGSGGSGNVLRFDDINSDAPYASTATTGLDCVWVTSATGLSNLSQLSWSSPVRTSKEPQINWMNTSRVFYPGGPTSRFGMKLTGNITIPATGTWNFRLGSDDGSRLTINSSVIINNDRLHSYRTRTGAAVLTAGTYPIEVLFFENTGSRGLRLEWLGPGDAAYSTVPATAFAPELDRRLRIVRWREVAAEE